MSEPPPVIRSHIDDHPDDAGGSDESTRPSMVLIHPEELVGHTFLVFQNDGAIYQAHIVEAIKDIEKFEDDTETSEAYTQFKCSMNDDNYDESSYRIRSCNTLNKTALIPSNGNSKAVLVIKDP